MELNEENAGKLLEAYRLVLKHYPEQKTPDVLDALTLCLDNSGLYVIPQQNVALAYFRYHPGEALSLVTEWDIAELKRRDLSKGPVLHIVFFAAPAHGYRIFRAVVNGLNPYGVSAHRVNKRGERVFTMKRHVRFR